MVASAGDAAPGMPIYRAQWCGRLLLLDRITFHIAPDIYHRRIANLSRTRLGSRHFDEWDRSLRLPGTASLEKSFLQEIQEYFRLSREEAVKRLESGADHFASHFAAQSPDLSNGSELERIYDETDLEVFELVEWHVRRFEDGPLNYVLALQAAREKGLKTYLDYGSGIGSGAILFARNGFDVTLADVSDPMLAFARWRLEIRNLPCRTIHLRKGPLPGDVWDMITLLDVLEHVADPLALMRMLKAHIDPERGLLVVRAPFDDERPQHIPHDMRTPSHFRGLGYRFVWNRMGRHGIPMVLTPSDRGSFGNRCTELVDYHVLGLAARALRRLRVLRLKALGRPPG